MNPASAVGQDESHLCSPDTAEWLGDSIHRLAIEPFRALRDAASHEGFNVAILSGFRSFDRQLSIWNRKVRGELAVLDSEEQPIDITALSEQELMFSILRWSALPGASRHHWGSDIDVFDEAARPPGYEVELVPSEYEGTGLFAPFSRWLDDRIARGESFGFFRPYDRDRQGVAPERWHLSYAPVAMQYMELLTPDLLRRTVLAADMLLKDVVLEHLDRIFARYVTNTNPDLP